MGQGRAWTCLSQKSTSPSTRGQETPFWAAGGGAEMPDPPKPWWRILLAYTEAGDLDLQMLVDEVVGVPQHDITAAPAILDRHEGEFFYVDNGKSGARGPGGEFRVWDGRVWKRDANEATVHRWIGAFWTALSDSIGHLERHVETVAGERRAELIASGVAEPAGASR